MFILAYPRKRLAVAQFGNLGGRAKDEPEKMNG